MIIVKKNSVKNKISDDDADEFLHSNKHFYVKHCALAFAAILLYAIFYSTWENWDPEMARWKAVGDSAFILLWTSMMIGPSVKLKPALKSLLIWRRTISIWAALMMSLHAYLIWDGWARWTIDGLLGYQKLADFSEPVLLRPGFGIANIIGLVALSIALLLLAISSDRAMKWLGSGSWKRLQNFSKTVYILVVIHMFYFVTMHYDFSLYGLAFDKGIPEANPHTNLFILLIIIHLVIAIWAFINTVMKKKHITNKF